jgi:parallel beta-helix repeat protein
MGAYVWGGHNMGFTDDSFDNNVMYGLDTHDVTTYLDVERNHFWNNGDHGFICSQACDHLSVISNESDHNGMVPWTGPTPTGDSQGGQVHGIMLHRGVTNTVVSNNNVHNQPNGAGIAVFDTSGDTFSGNTIDSALYGIRISVGSSGNTFTNNIVTGSITYGLYTYKGTDVPTYTTLSGHPTNNVFTGSSFGSLGKAIKLGETDGTTFNQDTFGGGIVHVDSSAGTRINGGVSDAERVELTGKLAEPTDVTVAEAQASLVTAIADAYSTIHVTSSGGQLYLVAKKWFSATVSPTGSDVHLTLASTGTTSGTTVAPANVGVVTDSGTATAKAQTNSTGARQISVSPSAAGQSITVTVTGLAPSHLYTITSTATGTTTGSTNGSGTLTFTDPGQAATYTVTA